MKKNALILLAILFSLNVFSQKNNSGFKIKCNFTNLKSEIVKLIVKNDNDLITVDSANSVDGVFSFKGNVKMPRMINIVFADNKSSFHFFVENKDITITGDFLKLDKVTITGSKTQSEYEQFMSELSGYDNIFNEAKSKFQEAQSKNDQSLILHYDSIIKQTRDKELKALHDVAFNKNKSVITPYIVFSIMMGHVEITMLDSIAKNFDKSLENDEFVKRIKEKLVLLHSTEVGSVAPEIEMADTNGVPFKLSSLRGKVILIDFWASWCRPCRGENPNVVAAYNAYKDKGFDILGVSLDQNKDSWLKAIKDDKLTWHHVSDLKYWNNAAAKLYGVNSIPHSVLLDKRGVIIATDLRGEALLKKLDEIIR
ncbi:MAG: TlpA disulfide reductase family protein [Bacteroidota bacterium]